MLSLDNLSPYLPDVYLHARLRPQPGGALLLRYSLVNKGVRTLGLYDGIPARESPIQAYSDAEGMLLTIRHTLLPRLPLGMGLVRAPTIPTATLVPAGATVEREMLLPPGMWLYNPLHDGASAFTEPGAPAPRTRTVEVASIALRVGVWRVMSPGAYPPAPGDPSRVLGPSFDHGQIVLLALLMLDELFPVEQPM